MAPAYLEQMSPDTSPPGSPLKNTAYEFTWSQLLFCERAFHNYSILHLNCKKNHFIIIVIIRFPLTEMLGYTAKVITAQTNLK